MQRKCLIGSIGFHQWEMSRECVVAVVVKFNDDVVAVRESNLDVDVQISSEETGKKGFRFYIH